jgi:hypothetical protein
MNIEPKRITVWLKATVPQHYRYIRGERQVTDVSGRVR